MLADMAIGTEAARGLVWRSAWAKDVGERNSTNICDIRLTSAFYASMAKAFASKTAVENANLGVQGKPSLVGADISLWWRRFQHRDAHGEALQRRQNLRIVSVVSSKSKSARANRIPHVFLDEGEYSSLHF
jgi:alkylation response protein AidB-like acyl-CoA dehydrogenase